MSPLPTTADGEGVAATLEADTVRAMSRLAARKEAMGDNCFAEESGARQKRKIEKARLFDIWEPCRRGGPHADSSSQWLREKPNSLPRCAVPSPPLLELAYT
uniref:Uncharacterized protein n=1 Tax=Oryza punctata TaxID=4537 RepID=A0A0E0MKX3_ORYPU